MSTLKVESLRHIDADSDALILNSSGTITFNGTLVGATDSAQVQAQIDSAAVTLTGVQTIAGAKTFSDNPVVENTAPSITLKDNNSASAIGSTNLIKFQNSTGTISAQIGNNPNQDAGQNFSIGTNVGYGLNFYTNDSSRMVINSAGKVGIGTTPSGMLDVNNTSASHLVANFRQNNASYNTDIGLYHTSASSDNTLITKRSSGDLWLYQGTAKNIEFHTSGLERVRVLSSGRVYINDGPNVSLGGFGTESAAGMNIYPDAGFVAINADTTNHALYIAKTSTATAGYINFATNGTTRGAIVEEGSNIGIRFGSTATSAHTLDDYEEGTWTPTLYTSALDGSYSVTLTSATYTKVGRQVTLSAYLVLVVTTVGTGQLRMGGLPYNVDNTSTFYGGSIFWGSGGTKSYIPDFIFQNNNNYIRFLGTNGVDFGANGLPTGSYQAIFVGHYNV